MQRIGFIGASGMMGHGMARNLLAKGHPLVLTVHRNAERVADLLAGTVAGPVTGAGILADSVPVSSLTGTLSYTLYSELQSNPAWYNVSDPAVVTGC